MLTLTKRKNGACHRQRVKVRPKTAKINSTDKWKSLPKKKASLKWTEIRFISIGLSFNRTKNENAIDIQLKLHTAFDALLSDCCLIFKCHYPILCVMKFASHNASVCRNFGGILIKTSNINIGFNLFAIKIFAHVGCRYEFDGCCSAWGMYSRYYKIICIGKQCEPLVEHMHLNSNNSLPS